KRRRPSSSSGLALGDPGEASSHTLAAGGRQGLLQRDGEVIEIESLASADRAVVGEHCGKVWIFEEERQDIELPFIAIERRPVDNDSTRRKTAEVENRLSENVAFQLLEPWIGMLLVFVRHDRLKHPEGIV